MPIDTIKGPYRIATKVEKRREGETETYEVIENLWWHDENGDEITDPIRIAELERELDGTHNDG